MQKLRKFFEKKKLVSYHSEMSNSARNGKKIAGRWRFLVSVQFTSSNNSNKNGAQDMQNIKIIYLPLNEVLKSYSMLPRKKEGVVAHVVSSLIDLKSIWLSIGQTTASLYILYPMI